MAERTNHLEDVAALRTTSAPGFDATSPRPRTASTSESIRRDIESTRASLDEKLDALENKVRGVQTKAKQAFDFNYQVSQHPWTMFGASIAAGFAVGLLSGSDHHEELHWQDRPSRMFDAGSSAYGHHPSPAPVHRSTPRHDIFDTLKLAAGAAITDLARQAIHKYVPALGEQLDKVWQERGLTATSAASALFSRQPEPEPSSQAGAGDGGRRMEQEYNPSVDPATAPEYRAEMASRS